MRFKIPGKNRHIRIFERVQVDTDEGDYDIFDGGIEHSDGTRDTLVLFGGSFATAKNWYNETAFSDEDRAKAKAELDDAKAEHEAMMQKRKQKETSVKSSEESTSEQPAVV